MNNLENPLKDQQARDEISRNFRQNMLVEAGAGSGKTTSLTDRMVEAVAQGHVKAPHMAAITFTRKAAYQLKEKFQEVLETKWQAEKDPERAQRMEAALNQISLCFIGTLHSFCAGMLRERPVEAGINPDFIELDDTADGYAQEQAWEMFLKELAMENPGLLERLEAIGVDPMDLKDSAKTCVSFPEVTLFSETVEKPDIDGLKQAIVDFVEEIRPHLPKDQPEKGWDTLQEAVIKASGRLSHFDLTTDPAVMELATLFDKTLRVTLNRWPDKLTAKIFRDETAPVFVDTVIRPAVQQWQAYCHPIITKLVKAATDYYSQLRKQRGWVNFQDLLMNTTRMLRENLEVRQHFSEKYQCLLVDEFQDTDPIQAEMLLFLASTDPEEKEWTAIHPKPGSLFLVGDPKQSIYRFRRADMDTYHQVKKIIENTGGKVLKLTSNFRSLHALSRQINPLFEGILPESDTPEQAAYAPMLTQQEGNESCLQGVLKNPVPANFQTKDDIVQEDARRIAACIRHWVDTKQTIGTTNNEASYGDFLILTRYRDGISEYTNQLEAQGIPYRVSGSSVFGALPEIQESITLLQYLAQPANEILGMAVLRGLFFGYSDEELYHHRKQKGSFRLLGKQPDSNALKDDFQRLQHWHQILKKSPLSVVFEKILQETDLLPASWLEEGGRIRCGHLVYLMEVIKQEEAAGNTTLHGLLETIQNLAEKGVEEELDITGEENVVRVMNLHKAKGLESSVVFLAHPSKMVSWPPTHHIQRAAKEVMGHFVYMKSQGNFQNKILGKTRDWKTWQAIETTFLEAEEDRLLYVAATRAKHLLVVSGAFKNHKNPWERLLRNVKDDHILQISEMEPETTLEASTHWQETKEFKLIEEDSWLESLSRPSYHRKSPTDMDEKKLEAMWLVERETGGGKAWGNVVHRLLEYLVKHRKDITMEGLAQLPLNRWLEEEGLPAEGEPELMATAKQVMTSPLWKRIRHAEKAYAEVPFHVWVTEAHPLASSLPVNTNFPVYYSGVMDLVLKETEGWVIVDYKTDRPKDPKGYEVLKKAYEPQLIQYQKVWESITGETVTQAFIHFLNQSQEKGGAS